MEDNELMRDILAHPEIFTVKDGKVSLKHPEEMWKNPDVQKALAALGAESIVRMTVGIKNIPVTCAHLVEHTLDFRVAAIFDDDGADTDFFHVDVLATHEVLAAALAGGLTADFAPIGPSVAEALENLIALNELGASLPDIDEAIKRAKEVL